MANQKTRATYKSKKKKNGNRKKASRKNRHFPLDIFAIKDFVSSHRILCCHPPPPPTSSTLSYPLTAFPAAGVRFLGLGIAIYHRPVLHRGPPPFATSFVRNHISFRDACFSNIEIFMRHVDHIKGIEGKLFMYAD